MTARLLRSFTHFREPAHDADRSPGAGRRSVTEVHQPPAKVMAAGGPHPPPDPAAGAAAIDRLRSDRDPDRHGRRGDRPARIPAPAPAAIPAAAAPAPAGTPAPAGAPPPPAPAPPAAVKASAVKAAMPLRRGGRRRRRGRGRHSERGDRRNHGLPDGTGHEERSSGWTAPSPRLVTKTRPYGKRSRGA